MRTCLPSPRALFLAMTLGAVLGADDRTYSAYWTNRCGYFAGWKVGTAEESPEPPGFLREHPSTLRAGAGSVDLTVAERLVALEIVAYLQEATLVAVGACRQTPPQTDPGNGSRQHDVISTQAASTPSIATAGLDAAVPHQGITAQTSSSATNASV
jgi:hypothetical protein